MSESNKLVASSGNKKDVFFDGIWKLKGHRWCALCVHGSRNGNIAVKWKDQYTTVNAKTLRDILYIFSDISIPENEELVIMPCYPKSVRDFQGNDLKENNIKLLGNWKGTTIGVYTPIGNTLYATSRYYVSKAKKNNESLRKYAIPV